MADLAGFWGTDLSLSSTGDLATVDNLDLTTQRLLRRFLTNLLDYLWHPEYGAGLPSFIGKAVPPATVVGAAAAQVLQEQTVARTPAPVISAKLGTDLISMTVLYYSATSGAPVLLEFDVTP